MSIDLLKNIAELRPVGMALLGLDVGKKTIGVALSDPAQSLATPLETIKRTKFTQDILRLQALVEEYEVGGFVIGLPVNMDGSEGPRAQSVRDFALELVRYPEIVGREPWIALQDERLSTVSVEEAVDNFVDKRKTRIESKQSGLIDKLAAQVILQSALNGFY
ncbi:MAG: Holliday junction resolvase RuvX [Alphaproteobacteria bacterium]|nr:Holliday junction resolvase RuvX [Alphaproteobacteria bacterium]